MFKFVCVMAVLFCQHGAFGSFRIEDVQRKIGGDLNSFACTPLELVANYSVNAEAKYALGCLLSGTGGVEISEERTATPEEQDIMLQGAAMAFDRMAKDDVLLCLNGVYGQDFTPKPAAGPNVNTHRAFMRAFGLAALISKLGCFGPDKEACINLVIQGAGQCFSQVGYDQGVKILRYLRDYAHRKSGIWANYEEGFNRVLTGLVAKKMQETATIVDAYSGSLLPQVPFVSTYHNWENHNTNAALRIGENTYVVIQKPLYEPTLEDGTVHGWRIRAHGVAHPDVGLRNREGGMTELNKSATVTFYNTNREQTGTERGSVHIHDDKLSPDNMEVPGIPHEALKTTNSFMSKINVDERQIDTFHILLPQVSAVDFTHYNHTTISEITQNIDELRQRIQDSSEREAAEELKDLTDQLEEQEGLMKNKISESLLYLYVNIGGPNKLHVQKMIDFIARELQDHRL